MRVLCLDGGGVRGALSAAFLAHIEAHLDGGELIRRFDLVLGTSTGAIIALGLAAGMSTAEVLSAYVEAGPRIFRRPAGIFNRMSGPAHSNDELISWLRRFLGDRCLRDAVIPVAIPTFDAATGTPRVWKTNHHERLHSGAAKSMWEVALASAAAPTYLPATQIDGSGAYLDGGLWANNPSLVGIAEAVHYLGCPPEKIALLSIGTGHRKTWLKHAEVRSRGIIGWGGSIVDLIFEAQSESVHQQARLLLRPDRYMRVDVDLPRNIALDDAQEIPDLVHLGTHEGEKRLADFKLWLGSS